MSDRAQFEAFILECHERPWAWGTHDCLQFCAAAVKELTGQDFASQFGSYQTRLGAYRILCKYPGMADFISSILGPPKPRNLTRFGDVVMTSTLLGETAGICVGSRCLFAGYPKGIESLPLSKMTCSWSCPNS